MEYIKGKLKKIIFESSNGTGYKVGLIRVKEASDALKEELENKTITFTGYFYDLVIDENYILEGDYIHNDKYGYQFKTASYEHAKIEGKDAILEFLTSSLVKGCGEKTAQDIVNTLGDDALNIIKEDKEALLKVPKMTTKKMDSIYNSILKYQNSDELVLYLTKLGFNIPDSMTLLNVYGLSVKAVIEENIYTLINEIDFKTLDRIYFNLKDETDDNRILACIIESLKELSFDIGDTYSYIEEIREKLTEFNIILTQEELNNYLDELIKRREVKVEGDKYFIYEMYKMEKNIAETLYKISNHERYNIDNIEEKIDKFSKENNIIYNDDQIRAIRTALMENITIITGGPGTGKTTIVKAITALYGEIFHDENLETIALLAPTGRAAKRMSESSGFKSSTIHRFLKWNKDLDKFQVNEHNKSDVEFVIIDEASMVDVNLFASLLRGLKKDVRIIMVGDYNQLPSVGPGQVLKDLIESDKVEKVILKNLYRQAKGSNIVTLAYDLNEGNIDKNLFEDDYLKLIEVPSSKLIDSIKDICIEYKDSDYKDFQILVPMYKTINGIDNINKIAQDIFNPKDPKKNEIKVGDVIYRENDKVLELTNMPDENIYNGDIGIISKIDKKDIYIDFYGNIVKFTPANFINFKHGYAISIHKSQGSEFKTVVIPVSPEYKKMLYRKLYYTGVTRAKERLYIIGDYNSLVSASLNNSYDIRRTTIKDLLKIS